VISGILKCGLDSPMLLDILELRDLDTPSFDIIHDIAEDEGIEFFGKDDEEEFGKDKADATAKKEKMKEYRKDLKGVRERVKADQLAKKKKQQPTTCADRFQDPLSRWKRPPVAAMRAATDLDEEIVRMYLPPPNGKSVYYCRAHDHQKRWEFWCKPQKFYRSYSYGKHGYANAALKGLKKAWRRFGDFTCLQKCPFDLDDIFDKWLVEHVASDDE
jgi:hypothetical protein